MPLKVTHEEEGKYLRVTITVPRARCKVVFDEVLEEARQKVDIPGTSDNANASADAIISAAGGHKMFYVGCAERLLRGVMPQAMRPFEDRALDSTMRIQSNRDELSDKFAANEDFTFKVQCELGKSEVKFKEPYVGLKIEVPAVLNQQIEDYQVERALIYTRREQGGSMHLAQRPAQAGDTLVADYNVAKKADGKSLSGMGRQRVTIDTMDDSSFLPGIMHKLEGMEAGETRHLDFDIPNIHAGGPGLPQTVDDAFIPAVVSVTVKEVYEWRLPELTLAMCQKVSEEAESVDHFKEECRQAIRSDASIELQSRIQGALMNALAGVCEVENRPETSYEEFVQSRYEADLMQAIQNGIVPQEDVERFTEKSALERYGQERREVLEGEFRALMAMDKVFELEKLELNEDIVQAEFNQAMERAAQLQEESREETPDGIEAQAMDYAKNEAMNYAVLAFLEEKATVVVRPLPEENAVDLEFNKRSVFMD